MSETGRTVADRLVVAAETDVGRVRENNEDAYVVAAVGDASSDVRSHGEVHFDARLHPVLLAVSDGIGGEAAGETASALALESLRRFLPPDSPDWGASLRGAVEQANQEVWAAGQRLHTRGMGATLTAVWVHGNEAHVAEVGDSRAYLLRDGELRLLTHDQSYVQFLVDAGVLEQEEAEHSPMKNVIVSAMGHGPDVRVDIGRVRLETNDKLLVCSDGLSNELTATRMRDVLVESETPRAACARLIALANEHGGNDNITVIVAQLTGGDSP